MTKVLARDITIVTTDWEPYFASTLEEGGVLTEIVKTAFKRKGHKISLQWYPWKRCMVLVAKGKRDIALGAYFSKERAKTYYYSDPFFDINVGIIALKEAGITSYSSLHELKEYTIGVTKNWVNSAEFDKADYLRKDISQSHIITIRKLFGRRIDMIVTSIPVFQYEVGRLKHHNLSEIVVLNPLLSTNELYLISSIKLKDHKKIIQDFNKGLAEIKKDGTYGKIFSKHGF
ncbi:substrate-binding periplasmic protein [Spartinivicinus poritis]|uniref:Transporter substrate-binding domain-containing protein n=1 Tax=Spartinivicinus poritis TaxID=2994640 RepID=A0ABT5UCA4_9GAMM|nr:transporter substrate-binding domain-containing protein [Spartinivicinus sp. A2-2]MDE1464014.1 transporter substrate-binding domain-containing protein [Spartinivicinus sp. A2-2]